MSPYASSYARVAYNSVSGAFVRFYANENKMVVLVWKYVLWLTLQTERMRNSKGSQPMSTSLSQLRNAIFVAKPSSLDVSRRAQKSLTFLLALAFKAAITILNVGRYLLLKNGASKFHEALAYFSFLHRFSRTAHASLFCEEASGLLNERLSVFYSTFVHSPSAFTHHAGPHALHLWVSSSVWRLEIALPPLPSACI